MYPVLRKFREKNLHFLWTECWCWNEKESFCASKINKAQNKLILKVWQFI